MCESEIETNKYEYDKHEDMSFKRGKKTYYKTKSEALDVRRKGDRIYYDADLKAYYIVIPKKRSFWGFLN